MLAAKLEEQSAEEAPHVAALMHAMKSSVMLGSDGVPADLVTMNSRVVVRDLTSGQVGTYTLVFPHAADEAGQLSVLSPMGTAILGFSCGDTIEWPGPGGRLRLRIEAIEYQPEAAGDEPAPPPIAIIAGFGVVGRCAAEALRDTGFGVTVLEINQSTIDTQTSLGYRAVRGDATCAEDLRAAGIDRATALIITIPDENDAIESCRVAHVLNPRVFIVARTNFVSKGLAALEHGADHVVVEEVVTAHAMRDVVAKKLYML